MQIETLTTISSHTRGWCLEWNQLFNGLRPMPASIFDDLLDLAFRDVDSVVLTLRGSSSLILDHSLYAQNRGDISKRILSRWSVIGMVFTTESIALQARLILSKHLVMRALYQR